MTEPETKAFVSPVRSAASNFKLVDAKSSGLSPASLLNLTTRKLANDEPPTYPLAWRATVVRVSLKAIKSSSSSGR